eukprot:m.798658 g.798658  ORF g.798658 m.798658 type:complete len:265 (-) comp59262_c0_seq5:644-1438(-)
MYESWVSNVIVAVEGTFVAKMRVVCQSNGPIMRFWLEYCVSVPRMPLTYRPLKPSLPMLHVATGYPIESTPSVTVTSPPLALQSRAATASHHILTDDQNRASEAVMFDWLPAAARALSSSKHNSQRTLVRLFPLGAKLAAAILCIVSVNFGRALPSVISSFFVIAEENVLALGFRFRLLGCWSFLSCLIWNGGGNRSLFLLSCGFGLLLRLCCVGSGLGVLCLVVPGKHSCLLTRTLYTRTLLCCFCCLCVLLLSLCLLLLRRA